MKLFLACFLACLLAEVLRKWLAAIDVGRGEVLLVAAARWRQPLGSFRRCLQMTGYYWAYPVEK